MALRLITRTDADLQSGAPSGILLYACGTTMRLPIILGKQVRRITMKGEGEFWNFVDWPPSKPFMNGYLFVSKAVLKEGFIYRSFNFGNLASFDNDGYAPYWTWMNS